MGNNIMSTRFEKAFLNILVLLAIVCSSNQQDQQNDVNADDINNSNILDRLTKVEMKLEVAAENEKALKAEIIQLKGELQKQAEQKSAEKADRELLLRIISEQSKDKATIKSHHGQSSEEHGRENVTLVNTVDRPSRLVLFEGPAAFHATIKTDGKFVYHLGVNQNIVFPDVEINLGGGYHPDRGVFIAPVGGLYIFSTSIVIIDEPKDIHVEIMKNGVRLAGAYSPGSVNGIRGAQGCVTVATQLDAGNEVWVHLKRPADADVYGDALTSFMGALVMMT